MSVFLFEVMLLATNEDEPFVALVNIQSNDYVIKFTEVRGQMIL